MMPVHLERGISPFLVLLPITSMYVINIMNFVVSSFVNKIFHATYVSKLVTGEVMHIHKAYLSI